MTGASARTMGPCRAWLCWALTVIGYERLETLEIIPISLRARVTLVPKRLSRRPRVWRGGSTAAARTVAVR